MLAGRYFREPKNEVKERSLPAEVMPKATYSIKVGLGSIYFSGKMHCRLYLCRKTVENIVVAVYKSSCLKSSCLKMAAKMVSDTVEINCKESNYEVDTSFCLACHVSWHNRLTDEVPFCADGIMYGEL